MKMYKDDQVVEKVHPSQIQNMKNRGYSKTPPKTRKATKSKEVTDHGNA